VKQQREEQEKIVEQRFQKFTQIRNTPLPTKGRRANYTKFNKQFRPIARRLTNVHSKSVVLDQTQGTRRFFNQRSQPERWERAKLNFSNGDWFRSDRI